MHAEGTPTSVEWSSGRACHTSIKGISPLCVGAGTAVWYGWGSTVQHSVRCVTWPKIQWRRVQRFQDSDRDHTATGQRWLLREPAMVPCTSWLVSRGSVMEY